MNAAVQNLQNVTLNTSTTVEPLNSSHLVLSPEQLAHFTDGDGLFLLCPEGESVGFIHKSNLDNDPGDGIEIRDEARNQLHLLEMLMVNKNGYLELNETAVSGLTSMLSNIQDKI